MHYLDNAATTRPRPEVIALCQQIISQDWGNPSSLHPLGLAACAHLEEAREALARICQVPLAGVIFVGSGSESDNLAIQGVMMAKKTAKASLVTSPMEHSAVAQVAKSLSLQGVELRLMRLLPNGQVDLEHLAGLVDDSTRLVSLQQVNSETGIIQDLSAVSQVVKAQNPACLLHADGVQAFGRLALDLKGWGVDLYSLSAHKIHGLKGAGALIRTSKIPLHPLVHGGGQEYGLHSGTENVAAIACLGLAAKLAEAEREIAWNQVQRVRAEILDFLSRQCPKIQVLQPQSPHVPHILNLALPKLPGQVLMQHLEEAGIYASTGSACNAKSRQLSPSLVALGLSPERIKGSLRISLSARENHPLDPAFFSAFEQVYQDLLAVA